MPSTPLKSSPLGLLSSDFIEISMKSCATNQEAGPGSVSVEQSIRRNEGDDTWTVMLTIEIGAINDQPLPPYVGHVTLLGNFKVHEDYRSDPERLIRITAVSMLYGAAREMFANLTARSANGMMLLPSVSFYEDLPAKKPASHPSTRDEASRRHDQT